VLGTDLRGGVDIRLPIWLPFLAVLVFGLLTVLHWRRSLQGFDIGEGVVPKDAMT
jgi:hypothetical protein